MLSQSTDNLVIISVVEAYVWHATRLVIKASCALKQVFLVGGGEALVVSHVLLIIDVLHCRGVLGRFAFATRVGVYSARKESGRLLLLLVGCLLDQLVLLSLAHWNQLVLSLVLGDHSRSSMAFTWSRKEIRTSLLDLDAKIVYIIIDGF